MQAEVVEDMETLIYKIIQPLLAVQVVVQVAEVVEDIQKIQLLAQVF
jgi:hypothetical protein